MLKIFKNKHLFLNVVIFFFIISTNGYASNLSVSNVTLGNRNPSAKTLTAQFDLSWDNAWRTKINHDAIWITIRLHNPSVTPTNKKLCQITDSGLNPANSSLGNAQNIEIYVPEDKRGAFVRLNDYGIESNVSTQSLQLQVDFESCGFTESDSVYLNVFALEMVYVPQGAFYAGDYNTSTATFNQGSADSDPWYIDSESSISASNPTTNGYRYVSAGFPGEDTTGASFTIADEYPKGYQGIYMMKYELTEGQWVEFINALPSANARSNHDLTDNSHKNTDSVVSRNTISCSGSPLSCSTQRPHRPVSFLNWMDLTAFLDWAALRPMTELEYEKAARGPGLAEEGEYSWGSTMAIAAETISPGNEDGTEGVLTANANATFSNVLFTGGDAPNGPGYAVGPLRCGIFATSTSTRQTAGASYYGVMELSGNLSERTVTVGSAAGRIFQGTHGDGILSSTTNFEGYANEIDWPGIDIQVERGVTGADGSGYRGGSFVDANSLLRISDRSDAANADTSAKNYAGGRGVRTYDGN